MSEPHTITKNLNLKIRLMPCAAKKQAERQMQSLLRGKEIKVNDLEVLDTILNKLPKLYIHCLTVKSGKKSLSGDMIKRIRFERGLDPRP